MIQRLQPSTRRSFLTRAAGAFGLWLLPKCGPQGQFGGGPAADPSIIPFSAADSGAADAGQVAPGADAGVDGGVADGGVTPQCLETEDNILGPFYRRDAPFRRVLGSAPVGEALVVRGVVRGVGSACGPLGGALLDVWQADGAATYDNQSPDFRYRGRLNADADGSYEFQTVLPGRYLNGGSYRPRHIHVIVTHPGFVSLTTQLYFAGDPYLASDPFVRPSLVIPLSKTADEVWRGTFDIVLAGI